MKTLSQIKYTRYHPSQNNIYYDLFKLSSVGYPLEISDWIPWNKNIFLIYVPTTYHQQLLSCIVLPRGMHTFCKSFLSIIVNFHLIPVWSESKFSLFIVSLKWEKYVESFLFHDDFLLHTHTHIFPPLIGRSSSSFLVFSLPPCLVSLFALTQFYCVFCFSLPFLRFPFCLPFLVGSWNSKKEIA